MNTIEIKEVKLYQIQDTNVFNLIKNIQTTYTLSSAYLAYENNNSIYAVRVQQMIDDIDSNLPDIIAELEHEESREFNENDVELFKLIKKSLSACLSKDILYINILPDLSDCCVS